MLHLSRTSSLTLYPKLKHFTRDFWAGLTLAIFFHLLFFLLIRIVQPADSEIAQPIQPVAVEIDLGIKAPVALLSAPLALTPKESTPSLSLPSFSMDQETLYLDRGVSLFEEPFEDETMDYEPLTSLIWEEENDRS